MAEAQYIVASGGETERRRKRVLMLAFHFPPLKGSSGLQRSLNFVRDLPQFGWEPRVLTASRMAYPATSDEQLGEIPQGVSVRRLPCIDAGRHLAISGAYPDFLAWPDRWSSWLLPLTVVGLKECAVWRPDVVWSTFPIATAIVGGAVLARVSRRPWVMDLRDSMTEDEYPRDPTLRNLLRRIEAAAVKRASAVVFTSPGALHLYSERYPKLPADRWVHIPNGYDESQFQRADALSGSSCSERREGLLLLHSGLLDPNDRTPIPFFRALAMLKHGRDANLAGVQVVLRASGHDCLYASEITRLGIDDIVRLAPPMPYVHALREMMNASGLLVFQGPNCNHQTPAKIYEYLRAGRPILALTDRRGDTASVLRLAGYAEEYIADINEPQDIARQLSSFLKLVRLGQAFEPARGAVGQWARSEQSQRLARLLDSLV